MIHQAMTTASLLILLRGLRDNCIQQMILLERYSLLLKLRVVVGKRKGGKARNKRVNKKNKSKNDKVQGGCRVISTPSQNVETTNETA